MALKPEYLQGLPDELAALTENLEAQLIGDIARRIAKAGEITDTSAYQIMRLKEMGASTEYIEKLLADYLKTSDKAIERMIFDAAQTDSEFYESVYARTGRAYVPFEHNAYLQQLAEAAVNQTKGELKNLTQSMGFAVRGANGQLVFLPAAKAYQSAMDKAHMLVASGGMDYTTAVRMSVNDITASGLRFVDYASGVRNHADVAARRAVLTGVSQMTGKISERNAAELGTDVVEVTAYAGARPDHALWQGKRFSLNGKDKRYPKLSTATGYGTVTGLKGANCRHDIYPVIPGIDQPAYTAEQLANIDPPPVTIGGKTYTYYEAEQRQREMERAIRKTKREIIAAEASGDNDQFTAKSVLLRRQREQYSEFSKAAGLLTRNERTQVAEFGRSAGSKAGWAARKSQKWLINSSAKMATSNTNDWSKTVPQKHSKAELDEISAYANKRGIKLYLPQKFDGDIEMLRQQINTISAMKLEYNIKQKITLEFANMFDDDFAETINNTIRFNNKAMRNAAITNLNLNSDRQLAATDFTGIAVHEMGHIISQKYGENGLDIARQAYYNVYKKEISTNDLIIFLNDNVSEYSIFVPPESNQKKPKYKEITPEVISKSKTENNDDFSREFIRILKEGIVK